MKGVFYRCMIALCLFAFAFPAVAASITSAGKYPRTVTNTVEFVIAQSFSVETVTCLSYAVQFDMDDIGEVEGHKCTSTGLLLPYPGTSGNIDISFDGLIGVSELTGCAESEIALFGDPAGLILQLQFICL